MSLISRIAGSVLIALTLVANAAAANATDVPAEPWPDVTEWALATAEHETLDRLTIYRYAKQFRAGFDRKVYPDRVVIVWRFDTETGLPDVMLRKKMDRFEDLLQPYVNELSVLTAVFTGDNSREWVFYAKSDDLFLDALNLALVAQAKLPLEIHTGKDPEWETYDELRGRVRE